MAEGRWTVAKFDGPCGECNRLIHAGERGVYLPLERTMLCKRPDCGPARAGEDPKGRERPLTMREWLDEE